MTNDDSIEARSNTIYLASSLGISNPGGEAYCTYAIISGEAYFGRYVKR